MQFVPWIQSSRTLLISKLLGIGSLSFLFPKYVIAHETCANDMTRSLQHHQPATGSSTAHPICAPISFNEKVWHICVFSLAGPLIQPAQQHYCCEHLSWDEQVHSEIALAIHQMLTLMELTQPPRRRRQAEAEPSWLHKPGGNDDEHCFASKDTEQSTGAARQQR